MLVILARFLYPYRWLFQLLAGVLVLFIVYGLVLAPPGSQEAYLMPSLVALLWTVLVNLMLHTFRQPPQPDSANASWWQRIKSKVKRGFYRLFTLLFILLSLLCVFLSLKMFGVWRVI